MARFKLAYIGAGSFRFSLNFFRNIVNAKELFPLEVALCDVDVQSLLIMEKILKRMIKVAASKLKFDEAQIIVSTSASLDAVLDNADFVYKSIAVGIQKSDWFDNYLPLKFGIPQNTGDTCGPGGLFRGLRTNHIAADIAEKMKKLCPKATLLNYTNPQGSIVMAARTKAPDVQYIGLCHELFGGMGAVKNFANEYMALDIKNWVDMTYEYGGINHFAWFTKLEYNGVDVYDKMREKSMEMVLEKKYKRSFNFFLLNKYNYFPYPGSRHVGEFMTEYYNYFNHKVQTDYWKFPTIREVWALDFRRKMTYSKFKRMAKGWQAVPKPRKEGEKAMEMTMDWKNSIPNPHVVNIPNTHQSYQKIIPQLPDDCIVEVPAYFKDQKILPVKSIDLPDVVADLVRPHAEQMRYNVDASLGNSLDLVVKAMQHDPMANWIEDDDKLEYLTKLMLYYQQEWLPEQWKEWIPKKEELEKNRWWVSNNDLSKFMFKYRKGKFEPRPDLKKKAFFWDKFANY